MPRPGCWLTAGPQRRAVRVGLMPWHILRAVRALPAIRHHAAASRSARDVGGEMGLASSAAEDGQVEPGQPRGIRDELVAGDLLALEVTVAASSSRPRGATTNPTAPLTRTGSANRAFAPKIAISSATARAPRTSAAQPGCKAAGSARRTTSGASTASTSSTSPARVAARNISTTRRLPASTAPSAAGAYVPSGGRGWRAIWRSSSSGRRWGDLVEGDAEHVVQHERGALVGSQPGEHDKRKRGAAFVPARACTQILPRLGRPAPTVSRRYRPRPVPGPGPAAPSRSGRRSPCQPRFPGH